MPTLLHSARRRAYTAILTVFRLLPAPLRRGVVRAGTPSFTVGAVCAVEHDGALLMLRQPHRPGWSLPGGLLGRGETAVRAVTREVREETGLLIEVGVPLTVKVNPRVRRVDVIFRVRVDHRPRVRAAGEATDAAWCRPDDVIDSADGPTREVLDLLVRAVRPGATDGRILGEAPT
jgi:8-oxo-dGTP diphosphatase